MHSKICLGVASFVLLFSLTGKSVPDRRPIGPELPAPGQQIVEASLTELNEYFRAWSAHHSAMQDGAPKVITSQLKDIRERALLNLQDSLNRHGRRILGSTQVGINPDPREGGAFEILFSRFNPSDPLVPRALGLMNITPVRNVNGAFGMPRLVFDLID